MNIFTDCKYLNKNPLIYIKYVFYIHITWMQTWECFHVNKNLAYNSASIELNTHILPAWNQAVSRFLTKIVHRSPYLFPWDSEASLGTFFFTLFSLVGISEPVQRKHLKAKNFSPFLWELEICQYYWEWWKRNTKSLEQR